MPKRFRREPTDDERIDDILGSVQAIRAHLKRGDLDDGLVLDALRVRVIEIVDGGDPS